MLGVALVGLASVACGDACADAIDKLEECGAVVENAKDSCETDGDECVADCINDATCAEINSSQENSYTKCILACL